MCEKLLLHHVVIFNVLIKVPCGNSIKHASATWCKITFESLMAARSVHSCVYVCIIITVYVHYCMINLVLVLHGVIKPC